MRPLRDLTTRGELTKGSDPEKSGIENFSRHVLKYGKSLGTGRQRRISELLKT